MIEDSLTGVSVDLSIVSFRGTTPIEYMITFKPEPDLLDDISFSRTPDNLFFDNALVKDTSYNVFVESIYATGNSYKRVPEVADVSFVTKNEEALSPDVITITPFGTYIEADINYEQIGDLSSNFDFEIIDQVSNVIELSGSAVAVNTSFNINTLETHSHKLQFNTLYRFKLVAKFDGTRVREYYTFKTFSTLDEFPLYISVSDNFTITGREASFNINGTEDISRNIDYVFYDVTLEGQNFSGNYDTFVATREEKEEEQMKKYQWEQDQIKHMKEYVARFGQGNSKMAKQAQSKEKVLEKMQRGGLTQRTAFAVALDM